MNCMLRFYSGFCRNIKSHSKVWMLAVILLMYFSDTSKAQVANYSFVQSAGTYTPITGGTVLGNTSTDDQRFVTTVTPLGGTTTTGIGFPIGFNFTYNGQVYDRFGVNANGWISFGNSALTPSVNLGSTSSYTPLSSTTTTTPTHLRNRVSLFSRDLGAQTGASIRFETIGTAPNRTLVVQWTNYRSYASTSSGYEGQIRINETVNP